MNAPAEAAPTRHDAAPETPSFSPADAAKTPGLELDSELLLLPDGRILAHHLTPEVAAALHAAGAR